MATFFSDFFGVPKKVLRKYGAFDVSLINDLPLFIDPFLLFHSKKPTYRDLHAQIVNYLEYLRDRAESGAASEAELKSWYCFAEVKQNWLGFSLVGNSGSGLGITFARSLHANLAKLFVDFGSEKITKGTHLEKVCLIEQGVGRDNISDFTVNLILDFLCEYTETFAKQHIDSKLLKEVAVRNVRFNYDTETWETGNYSLPWVNGDFVLLTPRDLLTRDDTWINRGELVNDFESIPPSITDTELRAQVANYFRKVLAKPKDREPNKQERADAASDTIRMFPQVIDYYILKKEHAGKQAESVSSEKRQQTEQLFDNQVRELQAKVFKHTNFYKTGRNTYEESHLRVAYLKDVIENKGGHRSFYLKSRSVGTEEDLQRMFRLVWFGSPSDVSAEVNDGRGPADFKVSRGAKDKTIVEMKLARNTRLEQNLQKQVEIYKAASDAKNAIKVVVCFSSSDQQRVRRILKRLGLEGHKDVVVIDARADNKPSGSRAK